ncbi:unknown protein [Seminavis robusta]|uniref:C6H2-type domain-containing protein n=1 Tax=Seminavis robusta TaxID=568900 RepID=A0A9N8F2G3_9STRA|nr:unknown protein [Seminavis robusta]|eukprot:Sro2726_g335640.1 n/a (402) ;mRNA; f:2547-3752
MRCNKEEPDGERFEQCPRCHDEGFVPVVFCSQKCFKKSWSEHKKWHEEEAPKRKNLIKSTLQVYTASKGYYVWAIRSDYDERIAAALKKIEICDIAGAKKILREALKLDTRRPEAFHQLAGCFDVSSRDSEAIENSAEACKRWAYATLTGKLGDINVCKSVTIDGWANSTFFLADKFARDNGLKKPSWWQQDGMLTLAAILDDEQTAPVTIFTMRYIRAWALSGIISQGFSQAYMKFELAVPKDRTPEELMEASQQFRLLSESSDSETVETIDRSGLQSYSEFMMKMALIRQSQVQENCTKTPKMHIPGLWMIIHGLTSPSGATMNNKIGHVCMDGLEEGRVAVTVDGISAPKRIRPSNLWKVPFSEADVALISCLEEVDRWEYVRASKEASLAHSMAGKR